MTVHERTARIGGWTVALTTGRGDLTAALYRPFPLDPLRHDAQAAWEFVLRGGFDTNAPADPPPAPPVVRYRPRRLWRRWARRHPDTAHHPGHTAVGPWTVEPYPYGHGLYVWRLPEHDCPWHRPVPEDDCYPDGRYQDECDMTRLPYFACTCPRRRPWFQIAVVRPETIPAEPPF
ncbi:hypothetical protein ACFVZ3_14480 [Kitasatospora purpeofusca]|uniref:hypothetical protein n=1 Tax=Kitasatospora purpeofusca TaxID=67352 RepID=UPI0036C73CDC